MSRSANGLSPLVERTLRMTFLSVDALTTRIAYFDDFHVVGCVAGVDYMGHVLT